MLSARAKPRKPARKLVASVHGCQAVLPRSALVSALVYRVKGIGKQGRERQDNSVDWPDCWPLCSVPARCGVFCPNCGTQNPDAAPICSKCNFNLKGAAAPKFKGTMLMMNQPGAAPAVPGVGAPSPSPFSPAGAPPQAAPGAPVPRPPGPA